jgi:hypothetical protein
VFLSPDELYDLTGRKRKSAQLLALRLMRINYKVRPDGYPLVLRSHIEKDMGGKPNKITEPNWEAIASTSNHQ